MDDLLAAHRHATNNRAEIEASRLCGCFDCMQIYPADEVVAWSGFDLDSFNNPDAAPPETALCPRCGSESVIGDTSGHAIKLVFLQRMNEAWCQKTIVRRPSPKQ